MTPRHRWKRFWAPDVQADIDEEMTFHLQERVEELRAAGLAPEAAHAVAIGEFGDQEEVRREIRTIDDRRLGRSARREWLRDWGTDLRWAARSLRRTPIVTLTIVLTLALGLGANGAIFSLLDAIYLRQPAGVEAPSAIRRLWFQVSFHGASGPQYWPGFSVPDYVALREALGQQVPMALYRQTDRVPLSAEQDAPTIAITYADSGYYPLLGVTPARGRAFTPEELRLGSELPVAIISDAFWRSQYDGADDVLTRTLVIGSREFRIVGVMPPAFTGVELHLTDAWLPLGYTGSDANWWQSDRENGLAILLRPGAALPDGVIAAHATAALRHTQDGADSTAVAALGALVRARGPGEVSQELALTLRLAGVAAIVLLIAAANIANLLLARATHRGREIAVRVALGVSRARLIRLLATETLLLALLSALAALLAAQWGGLLLRHLLLPDVAWSTAPVTPAVAGMTLGLAIVVGGVAGVLLALLRSEQPLQALRAGARGASAPRSRLRRALTMAQAALSVVLLAGAGLFASSLRSIEQRDIGFDASHLTFVSVRGSAPAATIEGLASAAERISHIPGVEAATLSSMAPLAGFSFASFRAEGSDDPTRKRGVISTTVAPGYFRATGLRVLRGSDFETGSAPQVVVNETLAHDIWGTENPVGRCLHFGESDDCWRVSGVVETAILDQLLEKPEAQIYLDGYRHPDRTMGLGTILVRTRTEQGVSPQIRAALGELFPEARTWVTRFSDALAPQYRPWQLGAMLFALFGVLALLVAAVGIYSMVAYQVQQRTREFGIRFALGATSAQVMRLVVRDGLQTVAIGAAVGIGLSLLLGRLVAALLYQVSPGNPVILAMVTVAMLAIAMVATGIPAWRAARIDPARTLQGE